MRQNISFPFDEIEVNLNEPGAELTPPAIQSRLAFVQVGLWEVRRRWLTGQTSDLDRLLACLDEDVERLRQALHSDEQEAELTATS
jgi:hypothetical protein